MKHNRQGFAGWFIRSVVLDEVILLYGDGEQKRDFNFVDDVVDAFLLAAASPQAEGETFNLGAPPPTSLRAVVELLYEVSGKEPTYKLAPFPEERRRIDIGDFYVDYGKIERALGWSPKTPLTDGVSKTIEFYREHIEHYLT